MKTTTKTGGKSIKKCKKSFEAIKTILFALQTLGTANNGNWPKYDNVIRFLKILKK